MARVEGGRGVWTQPLSTTPRWRPRSPDSGVDLVTRQSKLNSYIQDTTAIAFGGASGLGEATARRLAAEGANASSPTAQPTARSRLADEIGGSAVTCDVTDAASVEAAVAAAQGVRIAVVCAGLGTPAKLIGRDGPAPLDVFANVINVNLIGTINALRVTAGTMVAGTPEARGEPASASAPPSIAACDGQIGQVALDASKGGVVDLTLPVARELAGHGVRLVTIAPGLFETPMLAVLPSGTR